MPKSIPPAPGSLGQRLKRLVLGLQFRTTVSYALTTLAAVLLIELLVGGTVLTLLSRGTFAQAFNARIRQTAALYALAAAAQSDGSALDPRTTFEPGQPASLALTQADFSQSGGVSYLTAPVPANQSPAFALVITPAGRVLASSFPGRYPASAALAQLLPHGAPLVTAALAGTPGADGYDVDNGRRVFGVVPVFGRGGSVIGAVYAESPEFTPANFLQGFGGVLVVTSLFWLLLTLPVGGLFGLITTRRLVRRVERLVAAADGFAAGDETKRVPVGGGDELGRLEDHFNQMAQQLVEGQAQRQILIEQNARQAERARMEQEMRTAQHIQQSLLPRQAPALPGWQFTPWYKPAREVGGDFYDFLALDDGRLGIFIGDVAGKGVPAALVMAITRTLLRSAAHTGAAPGQVLAATNDLLSADIPPGMFVTCFYALLEPGNGRLRYANAGHVLPYLCRGAQVSEVRATGMPLGLMPDPVYEEFELALMPGDCVLFHSDGLVEAHNPQRQMFGVPRLVALLQSGPQPGVIIDRLLAELGRFTAGAGEQEDDLTLLTVQRVL